MTAICHAGLEVASSHVLTCFLSFFSPLRVRFFPRILVLFYDITSLATPTTMLTTFPGGNTEYSLDNLLGV